MEREEEGKREKKKGITKTAVTVGCAERRTEEKEG